MKTEPSLACDCIVIGAGLAGLTSAFEFARRGFKTSIIFDPKDQVYATKATHGISTIKGILESDAGLFGLKLEGHRGFSDWLSGVETIIGRTRPAEAWKVGVEEAFQSFEDFQKEFGRIYRKDFIGAKRVIWAESSSKNFAKVFYPGDWWIDPSYLIDTLWLALEALNVEVVRGFVNCITSGGAGFSVKIGDESSRLASSVIVCAGVGAQGIVERSALGLNEKILAVDGYTFTAKTNRPRNVLMVKGTSGASQIGERLYWGSTSGVAQAITDDFQERAFQEKQNIGELSLAKEHLVKLMPEAKDDGLDHLKARWGVRVRTRHRAPLVQQIENGSGSIWVNTGYYKSGIILSWLMAKRIANAIDAERPYSSNR